MIKCRILLREKFVKINRYLMSLFLLMGGYFHSIDKTLITIVNGKKLLKSITEIKNINDNQY